VGSSVGACLQGRRLHPMAVEVGQIVDGSVTKLTEYGVFVRLPDGQTGLVHISEIADTYVRDVADYFEEGDSVKVKVLGINARGRLELSAKQAEPRVPLSGVVEQPARPRRPHRRDSDPSFEERLSKFLKSSEQRLAVLRRNRDAKRRKRGRR